MKCPECEEQFIGNKSYLLDGSEYCSVRCINTVIKREIPAGNKKFKYNFNYKSNSSERTLNMIRNTRESLKLKFKQQEEK